MTYPTKKLGEIGYFLRGVTYKKGNLLDSHIYGCTTLLRANNINNGLKLNDLQFLPAGFVDEKKILKKGDIIFCMSSGSKHLVGKNTIISELENYSFGAFCSMFRLNTRNNINYISYFLKSNNYKDYIFNFSQGVNILNLKNSDLEKMYIPLPPLPTQKLIVQKLDSAFKNIDESIKIAKKNIENIEELNKSVLKECFKESYYEMRPIGDMVEFGPKKSETKTLDENTNVSFVPMKYVKEKKKFFNSEEVRKLKDVYKGYTYFQENDVLLAKVTPCFENGKSGIAKNLTNGIGFGSSEYYIFRVNNDTLKERIYYAITTDKFLKEGANNMSGAVGLKRVTKDFILNYKIPLPPLEKQKEIVSYLDKVFEKNKVIKEGYEKKLRELEKMKQSILKEAFEGRLVKD